MTRQNVINLHPSSSATPLLHFFSVGIFAVPTENDTVASIRSVHSSSTCRKISHYPTQHATMSNINGEPCYHGYPYNPRNPNDRAEFMNYSIALATLKESYCNLPNDQSELCLAVDSVMACQNQIPITTRFSKFLVSTAVDALVDGDPDLPPSMARILAQQALMIEKLAMEKEGTAPTFETEKDRVNFRYQEICKMDSGADIVPILKKRIPCQCLDGKALCFGCHDTITGRELQTCSGCGVAQFCSKACHRKAWKEQLHRENCKKIKHFVELGAL